MTDALYLRLKSLNTRTVRGVTSPKNIVRVAAMHNLREIQAELGTAAASGINPARMHLNYQLRGPATADGVAGLALALLDNAGVTALRRDACMALELVVSLPAATAIDHREYFAAAVAWADAFFAVPILSAAVHLDEAAPHCHILLMPLVAGRMQGGALAGGPTKIRAMLADFQQQVAQRFGVAHQPRAKRLSKPNRDAAGRMVLDELRARPERLSEPGVRDALIIALGCQAETLLALLGLSMSTSKAKAKSFVDIMTAPCKPERTRRAVPNTKHIDVAQNLGNPGEEKFDNVYLCVDVAPSPSPNPAHAQLQQPVVGATNPPADYERQQAAASSTSSVLGDQRENDAASLLAGAQRNEVQRSTGAASTSVSVEQAAAGQRVGRGMQNSLHTPARPVDQAAPAPSTTDQAAPTSASAAPAKRMLTAASRQSTTIAPAPGQGGATEQDASNLGAILGGVQNFEDTPTAAGDALKTQQVDQVGGHTDAHQSSPAGGGHPGPRWGVTPEARDDYQRQRDDDHPADCWDEQRGEFVTVPCTPTRPPYNARASPATLAHHLLALVSTTDYEPLNEQKDRYEPEPA